MASKDLVLSSKELLEAQSHLWNHIFNFINSLSLKCAVELGIPDAVYNHGKPITLTELANALSIPPIRIRNLQRLMTLLVYNGYFTQTSSTLSNKDEDLYSLTTNSAILVKENGGASIAAFLELALDNPVFDGWQTLSTWFKSEQPSTAFEKFHGVHFWDSVSKMPEWGNKMRDGFGCDSDVVAQVIIKDHGESMLKCVKSVVEVAGGIGGGIAVAIAKAFPEIKCTVMDHPQMIDIIEKNDVVEYVTGDILEYIPPADVLILKWVLMCWNNEECVKILKQCKKAVPTKDNGGKVILIEQVIDNSDGVHTKQTETQLFIDLQVMVHLTGKLRTEPEWKKLFLEAGFKEYNIIPALGMRSIIQIYH